MPYLTNRFFIVFGGITALFALSFAFPFALLWAKIIFFLALALAVFEYALLFIRPLPLSAHREAPVVFSLSDNNPVQLQITNNSNLMLKAIIIDELPVEFQKRDFSVTTTLRPGQPIQLDYSLRPLSRGEFKFGHINIIVSTLLGLVERKFATQSGMTVQVYPSVQQMKHYELIAIKNMALETGIKKIRRIGHSYEFEQIKNYTVGDDYRTVNWKASGRHNQLMVNQYEDERSQQVYCIIDKSRSMRMPFNGLSLMDYAVNATLALSNIMLKKYDRVGLLTFSDVLGATVKADRKPGQLQTINESLYKEKERPVEASFELLYQSVRHLVNVRSMLLLFTNFESSYALERALPLLRQLNRSHLVVVVFFENTEIRALSRQTVHRLSDIFDQTVANQFIMEKKEMVSRLRQFGIQAILTRPEDLTMNAVNKYLELKSRGLI
jgi:uncharacterized protein (DUF58 family)